MRRGQGSHASRFSSLLAAAYACLPSVQGRFEKIIAWVRGRPWSTAGLGILALLGVFGASVLLATPRLDRNWAEHLSVMPQVELRGSDFSLGPATDWTYNADGPVEKNGVSFAGSFSDLRNIWFVVEPQPGGDYAAHTLVLFEFAGERLIGVTVEARREADEEYDAIQGLFNKFELAYIWSTAKELLTRRAVFLKKDMFVYPLGLTAEQEQRFLRSMLEETVDVSRHPRFYNTLTSNCTNELAKAAGLGWHYSWVLTGYSPQRLFELKLIPGGDLDEVRGRAKLDAEIRVWNDLPSAQFDSALLSELRRRHGEAEQRPQS
jgi:hypothetical protein